MNLMMTANRWRRFRLDVQGKRDCLAWPRWLVILLGLLAVNGASAARADNSKALPPLLQGIGIDQRLNEQVPLDLQFRDETGKTVTLGDYFGKKPVILSLVYFGCPMLCTMAENGLLHSLQEVKFSVGDQFEVLTVSFDPHDNAELAAAKKAVYVGLYGRKGAEPRLALSYRR